MTFPCRASRMSAEPFAAAAKAACFAWERGGMEGNTTKNCRRKMQGMDLSSQSSSAAIFASVEKLGVYDTQHREAKTVQDRTAQLSARQAEAAAT